MRPTTVGSTGVIAFAAALVGAIFVDRRLHVGLLAVAVIGIMALSGIAKRASP